MWNKNEMRISLEGYLLEVRPFTTIKLCKGNYLNCMLTIHYNLFLPIHLLLKKRQYVKLKKVLKKKFWWLDTWRNMYCYPLMNTCAQHAETYIFIYRSYFYHITYDFFTFNPLEVYWSIIKFLQTWLICYLKLGCELAFIYC